jgi:YD repeat-containing protein
MNINDNRQNKKNVRDGFAKTVPLTVFPTEQTPNKETTTMKQHYHRLLVLLLTVPLFSIAHAAQYTYDKLHRLTAVTYDSGDSVYYKYDPAGNLLSVSMAPSYKIGGTLTGYDPSTGSAR